MTPITCAKPSPPRERSPSSPTTLHVPSNIPSTSISMPSAISWNAASASSSSSAESQPASKRPPEITAPSSLSQPSSCGCDKCPQSLVLECLLRPLSRMPDQCRQPTVSLPARFRGVVVQRYCRVLVGIAQAMDCRGPSKPQNEMLREPLRLIDSSFC